MERAPASTTFNRHSGLVRRAAHVVVTSRDALLRGYTLPSLLFNAVTVLVALGISCSLVYHGLQALCKRSANDVTTMSATYTVMAAGVLAWGLLMAIVWAY